MAGKNERQRRQARERHRRQQEQRLVRQRQVRQRWLIGLSGVLVLALVGSLLAVFLPSGKPKKPAASASKSPSASPTASTSATATAAAVAEPAHHCTYTAATPVAKKVSIPRRHARLHGQLPGHDQHQPGQDHVQPAQQQGHLHRQLLRPPGRGGLLRQHPVPPAGDQRHLRAAVRRSLRHRHRQADLQHDQQYRHRRRRVTISPVRTSRVPNTRQERWRWLTKARHSNGSQFFIVYKDSTSGLNGPRSFYTPFATVSSGLGIVQNVAKDGYSCQYVDPSRDASAAPRRKRSSLTA